MEESDKVLCAEMFAVGAHAGQKHGQRPYTSHLREVHDTLVEKLNVSDEHLLAAAWLHDTIEDTPTTYQDIKDRFGERVAEIVWAVTDEIGRNRDERRNKTWPKISATRESILLKLADTSSNVLDGIKRKSPLLQMYLKEWPAMVVRFHHALNEHRCSIGLVHLGNLDELVLDYMVAEDRRAASGKVDQMADGFEQVGPHLRARSLGQLDGQSTERWEISDLQGHQMGHIKWNGRFRQYCFATISATFLNSACLTYISLFMDRANKAHKEKRADKSHKAHKEKFR